MIVGNAMNGSYRDARRWVDDYAVDGGIKYSDPDVSWTAAGRSKAIPSAHSPTTASEHQCLSSVFLERAQRIAPAPGSTRDV
jgi:hypothetical protein